MSKGDRYGLDFLDWLIWLALIGAIAILVAVVILCVWIANHVRIVLV